VNPWIWFVLIIALAALLLWPTRGLLARWRNDKRTSARIQVEDVLKHLYTYELETRRPTLASIAGRVSVTENEAAALVETMRAHGLVQWCNEQLSLTPDGRAYALHIVRAHRLWERYLADETGYDETRWHAQAEEFEHRLTPEETAQLASRLGQPLLDPHGDPIPTEAGEMPGTRGQSLTAFPIAQVARIVHLEDEPNVIYAQLIAEGFYPGMVIRLLDKTEQSVRVWADNDEHLLAPIVAAAITVEPLPLPPTEEAQRVSLAELAPPERARVVGISPRCRGAERRRLLDLGIVGGTIIQAELVSPSGDPTAYRVRDTLIALRSEQASLVSIERLPQESSAEGDGTKDQQVAVEEMVAA
jgi:DtxR family Mn-dependent transcriptional regulator